MKLVSKAVRKESKTEKSSPEAKPGAPQFAEEEKQTKANPLVEAIDITIDERITATISKEGDLGKFEVKGEVFLYVNDESKSNAEVHLGVTETKGVTIKPHPELNRSLWNSQQIIAPKQGASGFPVSVKLEALKYKYATTNQNDIPFTVTVWSAKEEKLSVITVEIEYNSNNTRFPTIDNIKILIPLGTAKQPQV